MNIYDDYSEYMAEMKPLLKILKKTYSKLLFIIQDVITVCDYVEKLTKEKSNIDDDLAELFESGFSYIANILTDIKLYYEEYFNKDIILLNSYSSLILYHFYLDDFKGYLDVSELLTDERKKVIDDLEDEIDHILVNQKKVDDCLIERFEQLISEITPKYDNFKPVYAVFSLVCEELRLF